MITLKVEDYCHNCPDRRTEFDNPTDKLHKRLVGIEPLVSTIQDRTVRVAIEELIDIFKELLED